MDDAYGRLLYNVLVRLNLYSDENHALIKKSTIYHRNWRNAISSLRGCSYKDAKREVCAIRFGAAPRDDIPFVRALASQVRSAATSFLAHSEYSHFNDLYADRANPLFSRLAAILSQPEASTCNILVLFGFCVEFLKCN